MKNEKLDNEINIIQKIYFFLSTVIEEYDSEKIMGSTVLVFQNSISTYTLYLQTNSSSHMYLLLHQSHTFT